METKQPDVVEKPKPVKIFKMANVSQGYKMATRVGRFEGRLEFNMKSRFCSSAIRIMIEDEEIGYVPKDMVGEVLEFIGQRDVYPCRGTINSSYDQYVEQFYFWGECVVDQPDV